MQNAIQEYVTGVKKRIEEEKVKQEGINQAVLSWEGKIAVILRLEQLKEFKEFVEGFEEQVLKAENTELMKQFGK